MTSISRKKKMAKKDAKEEKTETETDQSGSELLSLLSQNSNMVKKER
jgi:hypothetical protein